MKNWADRKGPEPRFIYSELRYTNQNPIFQPIKTLNFGDPFVFEIHASKPFTFYFKQRPLFHCKMVENILLMK